MKLDREERINRYLDAMDAVHDMVSSRHPMIEISPAHFAQLLGLLNEEARKIVPTRAAPFLANDDGDDGGGDG